MSKAGGYRHPVVVQKLKAAVNLATVDRTDDAQWETLVSRRAKIQFKPGQEFLEGEQTQARIGATIWIRRDATVMLITPAMRVVSYGQIYEIVTANLDLDKQIDMILTCTLRK